MTGRSVDDDDRSARPSQALPRVVQPLDLDRRVVALTLVVTLLLLVLTVRRLRAR